MGEPPILFKIFMWEVVAVLVSVLAIGQTMALYSNHVQQIQQFVVNPTLSLVEFRVEDADNGCMSQTLRTPQWQQENKIRIIVNKRLQCSAHMLLFHWSAHHH